MDRSALFPQASEKRISSVDPSNPTAHSCAKGGIVNSRKVCFISAFALTLLGGCANTSGITSTATASSKAGDVVWKNTSGRRVAVHSVDTFDPNCPPTTPGGTFNFTLPAGGEHTLKLLDDQAFCWTWRFDDDPTTEPVRWCRAVGSDVIEINQSTPPASSCKERIKQ